MIDFNDRGVVLDSVDLLEFGFNWDTDKVHATLTEGISVMFFFFQF